MTTALTPFAFDDALVRTVTDDSGDFLFVAKDVALALDYSWQPNIVTHVPDEWKGIKRINTPGGDQEMICLTEQGLYFFLGRSDKPKALPFQKWLAGEVLPSIRKTGSYALPALSAEERHSLDYVTNATKRAVLKNLTDLARVMPARAATLEADFISLLLLFAPSQKQIATGAAPKREFELTVPEEKERLYMPESMQAAEFWAACEKLDDLGVVINHSRSDVHLFLDIDEILRLLPMHGMREEYDLRGLEDSMRYPMIARNVKMISARTGEEVACTVFFDEQKRFRPVAARDAAALEG